MGIAGKHRLAGRLRSATPVATPSRTRLAFRLALAVANGVIAHPVKVLNGTSVLILRGLSTLTEGTRLRQADLAAAAIIRVMTSETTAREMPTMAVAVLMREGYAVCCRPTRAFGDRRRPPAATTTAS